MKKNDNAALYCYELNRLLKDKEFSTAEIYDKEIRLYDKDGDHLTSVQLESNTSSVPIFSIRKDGNVIKFATQTAPDDENRYMFVNGEEDQIPDGVWKIVRVTGGYYYSTTP